MTVTTTVHAGGYPVSGVDFWVGLVGDGDLYTDNTSPYSAVVHLSTGANTITAIVSDNHGNTGSSQVTVTVLPRQIELDSDQDGYTFQSGRTYYIKNPISISGTTTIEPGAVIKYAVNASLTVDVLDCETTAANPAILTARDDDSVGCTLADSTHTVSSSHYANMALEIINDGDGATVQNLKIYHANEAIAFHEPSDDAHLIANITVSDCGEAVDANSPSYGNTGCNFTNSTVTDVGIIIYGDFFNGSAVDSTFTNVGYLADDEEYGFEGFNFTNCQFSNVNLTDFAVGVGGDSNGFHNCSTFTEYTWGGWVYGSNYFGSNPYTF